MQDSPVTSALTLLLRIWVNLGSGLNAYPLSYLSDGSRFEAYCVCVCVFIYMHKYICDLCNDDFGSAHYV